ncbi:fructose-bisphosphate aldolase class II [Metamycoplasma subdolum]|uniref:Fructose-bisphosphate aldolase class II n=1 Tax=Metamycoplasma subdolum TaxID=92407 RepID=A0A3M0A225_9BACT|nr:class II fructose-bisphosphate aldolase [Metamycoplasma subdolum]RMA79033.1 fructose-bisphosphate aldolase class II [Metamycoplasma subdolum]WPB50556.1 class II fructose-bisphosphate aldolase [Metamycoplasma subdolum]
MSLVNGKKIVLDAYKNKKAIGHFNFNNIETLKAILLACEEEKKDVIISASSSASKYISSIKLTAIITKEMASNLAPSINVCLHFDHGTIEECKEAINAGFTSVMYDGSEEEFSVNFKKTKELVEIAKKFNVSVEAEVGKIKGDKDLDNLSKPEEVKKMIETGIDFLAISVNNIHGKYPENWKGLDFKLLEKLSKENYFPFVLHGGSQIPEDQIKKAIKLGIAKINVSTEIQLANCEAIKSFVISNKINEDKNYDSRKIGEEGIKKMKELVIKKLKFFQE